MAINVLCPCLINISVRVPLDCQLVVELFCPLVNEASLLQCSYLTKNNTTWKYIQIRSSRSGIVLITFIQNFEFIFLKSYEEESLLKYILCFLFLNCISWGNSCMDLS